jgi:Tfp pilus assembly protein PilZ
MAKARASRSRGAKADVLKKVRVPLMQRGSLLRGGATEDLFIIDLALSGVFVERAEPLIVGEIVKVTFRLPRNEIPVTATCRVAWWHPQGGPLVSKSLPAGIGLTFTEISEADRAKVRDQLLDHFRREPGERRFSRQWLLADDEEGGI